MPHPDAHEKLVAECHDAAHRVFAAVNREAGPELLSLDLTMGQFKAMAIVTMYGPQPVGELGRRLGLSEPAASLLVDRLAELGLAVRERDAHDGRRTLVTATAVAKELAARLRRGREEHVLSWLGALSSADLEGLARGLTGLLRVAGDPDEKGAPLAPARAGEAARG